MPRQLPQSMGFGTAVLANLLVLVILIYATILKSYYPDLFHWSVQEDGYLEWATFWAFFFTIGVCLKVAVRQNSAGQLPWFILGLALFCFLFAMEEISWGQRWLGYRPPAYFLEHNFQQELNLHNVMGKGLRKLVFRLIIVVYGILLPLTVLVPSMNRLLRRAGVVVPPIELVPVFAVMLSAHIYYPWRYAGEIIELMLGCTFLFASLIALQITLSVKVVIPSVWRGSVMLILAWLLVLVLGQGTAVAVRNQTALHPENQALVKSELQVLARDLRHMYIPTFCELHKRVYSWVKKYKKSYMYKGEFSRRKAHGMPPERADFFLDPWNSPYWISDRCDDGRNRRKIYIYSFGPNRKRDSNKWELLGDDIQILLFQKE